MIKLTAAAGLVVATLVTPSLAGETAAVTPATKCNESQMKVTQNAVDSIKDPSKQAMAQAELKAAEAALQNNDTETCLAHITAASKFVTP